MHRYELRGENLKVCAEVLAMRRQVFNSVGCCLWLSNHQVTPHPRLSPSHHLSRLPLHLSPQPHLLGTHPSPPTPLTTHPPQAGCLWRDKTLTLT